MRFSEPAEHPAAIPTHPHIATIAMNPMQWFRFEQTFADRSEIRILDIDRSKPDVWTVTAACASREIGDLLASNW